MIDQRFEETGSMWGQCELEVFLNFIFVYCIDARIYVDNFFFLSSFLSFFIFILLCCFPFLFLRFEKGMRNEYIRFEHT